MTDTILDQTLKNDPLEDDHFHDHCGVFGVFNNDCYDVATMAYFALHALQHRGQESCGIATGEHGKIDFYKDTGLVTEVFPSSRLKKFTGKKLAIGHVRYPTSGQNSVINAQPFVIRYKSGKLAIAHNGNLVNAAQLESALAECGALFHTQSDTELMLHCIAHFSQGSLEDAIVQTMKTIKGSYSVVMTDGHRLIGLRDPQGIRPLVLGKKENSYILASESCALDALDAQYVRDVEPGEIIIVDEDGLRSIQTERTDKRGKVCFF